MRPLLTLLFAASVCATLAALTPEVLQSTNAIPEEIAGRFREAAGFQQSASGQYFIFDRRAHAVFGVDAAETSVWDIVRIGAEPGRIIDPTAFSVAPNGHFVVADAPNGHDRIQIFTPVGFAAGGFMLPIPSRPLIMVDGLVLNGIGSLQYTGTSILISLPETGGLITEYALSGGTTRTFGDLRATGHEDDPAVHLALNSGIPLVDPSGGYLFVFQAGIPEFRKYDAAGHLVFERRIEGREIDDFVKNLPTTWPKLDAKEGELPLVKPTVRTAAVDRAGNLWISLVVPYTYVYDRDGDKIRTVQFRAAGIVSPNSMFFGPDGRLLVTPGLYEFNPGTGR